jgi:small subunit ribosomal protein S20
MPHHKSCIKRVKTAANSNTRNRAYRSMMKTAIKRIETADNPETKMTEFRKVSSILDKLVVKKVIHRNKSANQKSRLSKLVSAAKTS